MKKKTHTPNKKKKPTSNQVEFDKQVNRIKKAIEKSQSLGIEISIEKSVLDKPKRITKPRLEALKKLTPEKIREKYGSVTFDDGEVVRYKDLDKETKQYFKNKKKDDLPDESYNIVSEILQILSISQNNYAANYARRIITEVIDEEGIEVVAKRVAQSPEQAKSDAETIAYDSDSFRVRESLTNLLSLVMNGTTPGTDYDIDTVVSYDFPEKINNSIQRNPYK